MGKHDSFGRSMNVQEQRYRLGRLCTMVMLYTRPLTPSKGVDKLRESTTPSEGV